MFGSVPLTIGAGHVIVGGWVSLTVTVKLHVDVFPDASVAVLVTVVVPTGKVLPEAGLLVTVTPGQLSLAVGDAKFTTAPQIPGEELVVILAGQVMVGACVSLTRIVNEQLPPPPFEVTVTVVVPTGKNEPEAGTAVTGPQIPDVVGAG